MKKKLRTIDKVAKINKDSLELLIINQDFQNEIANIRKKLGIDQGGFTSDELSRDWHKDDIETNEAQNLIQMSIELKDLLIKFELPKSFENAMSLYLLYNKIGRTPGQNYSIGFIGEHINVLINAKPTKDEWVDIKKHVNEFLDIVQGGKFPNAFKDMYYPNGSKVARPKPKLKRNLEILEKSKLVGKRKTILRNEEETFTYTVADVEAEVFPEGSTKQSKKNKGNIRTIRNRLKAKIKRST